MSNSDSIPIETNIDIVNNANPQPVQIVKKSKPKRIRINNIANTTENERPPPPPPPDYTSTTTTGQVENTAEVVNNDDTTTTTTTDKTTNTIERRSIIARINGYKYKFSKFLIDYDLDDNTLNDKTNDQLDILLLDIKHIVSINNATTLTDLSIKEAFTTFETIIYSERKINCIGIFKEMLLNPIITDLFNEVVLEYQEYLYVKPIYRLLLLYATQFRNAILMKNVIDGIKSKINTNLVSSNIIDKYKEL